MHLHGIHILLAKWPEVFAHLSILLSSQLKLFENTLSQSLKRIQHLFWFPYQQMRFGVVGLIVDEYRKDATRAIPNHIFRQ